ncbi:MAG: V-type ATP synthase subunit K [Kiritimatiellae bacterium]|jgi:V/A-type H+-transporting ATPase subunit K|nr:V-type ATP synthase subunit K [Kiritimatiellia bacterium]
MDASILNQGLGTAGAVMALGLSAVGSALGTGAAGSAAVGAWKKCYAQGRPAANLLPFVGAALTQTLYGMILMFAIKGKAAAADASGIGLCLIGIFAGLGIGASAIFQGRTAGAAADAYAETGKGFSNYIAAIGVIETVAIFVMVFAYLAI